MNINYLLLFNGYSNSGGPESSVRCFVKLEAAQAAMTESYRKYAAALNIPAGHGRPCINASIYDRNQKRHTSETLRRFFQWKIVEAAPEDGNSTEPAVEQHGLTNYMVTIDEHIAQAFSVKAYNIIGV